LFNHQLHRVVYGYYSVFYDCCIKKKNLKCHVRHGEYYVYVLTRLVQTTARICYIEDPRQINAETQCL